MERDFSRKLLVILITGTAAGCTKQACGFRDSYPDFTKYNFNVYCVSADTSSAQAKWQTKVRFSFDDLSLSLFPGFFVLTCVSWYVERIALFIVVRPTAGFDQSTGGCGW